MGTSLVTLAQYKAYAGISSSTQDTQITAIIPIASQLVKTYCETSFVDYVTDEMVEVFEGGFNKLALKETPLISVSSVEYSSDYGNNYETLTEFVDYTVSLRDSTIVSIAETFPLVVNGYKVTYNAGYETIPEDLKVATLDLVTYYLKNDMAVKSPKVAGSNTVQIEYITKNTLPSHISRVLDLYRSSWA